MGVTEYKIDPGKSLSMLRRAGNYFVCLIHTCADDPPRGPSRYHSRVELDMGTTTLTNRQILDPLNHARGVLRDIWTDPDGEFKGIYRLNVSDCMYFVQALLEPGKGPFAAPPDKYASFDRYFKRYIDELNHSDEIHDVDAITDVGLAYNYHVVHDPQAWDRIVRFPVDSSNPSRIFQPVIFQPGGQGLSVANSSSRLSGAEVTEVVRP